MYRRFTEEFGMVSLSLLMNCIHRKCDCQALLFWLFYFPVERASRSVRGV